MPDESSAERQALERIAEMQPRARAMIERNGFVFEDIGTEPGNWQHLAFSLYTLLCEADHWARSALEVLDEPVEARAPVK